MDRPASKSMVHAERLFCVCNYAKYDICFKSGSKQQASRLVEWGDQDASHVIQGIKMDQEKRQKLEAAGWKLGTTEEFLELTPEEAEYITLKLTLGDSLRQARADKAMTQSELATLLKSSQSRVAKMEGGDPSVSLDLLIRSLLSLGVSRKNLANLIAA